MIGLCVFLVFFELMGCMWMLNIVVGGYPIEMNAVFVVNLITSLGFGVEFCNHIGMNFLRQTGTRQERAMKAMNAMGSSVMTGIATTKLIGVSILAFAPSTLFKLYYFRMYLFIIILGVFNGLMFLPILLSWIGPKTVSHRPLNWRRTSTRLWKRRTTTTGCGRRRAKLSDTPRTQRLVPQNKNETCI